MEPPTVVDGVVHQAAQLIVGSDVMAVVAVVVGASAWVVAGWLAARAAAPHAAHASQFGAVASLVFSPVLPVSPPPRLRTSTAPAALVAMTVTMTSLLVVPAGIAAAAVLLIGGHRPTGRPAIVLLAGLAVAGAVGAMTVRRVRAHEGRHEWIARRGLHVGVAVLAGEALVLASSVLVAAAVTHTENSVVSFLEIGCAALVARAVTQVRYPPAGAVIADLTFLVLLVAVGVSLEASMAIVVVWRTGSVLAWCLLRFVTARVGSAPPLALAQSPTGSPVGERTHRVAFRALGLLPPRLRDGARRRLFDTLFAIADDPWAYDDLPYEARKRAHLLSHLPAHASVVVEVGCADGHVISAIAGERPDALVIGVDISDIAVQAARRRTASVGNTSVVRAGMVDAAEAIRRCTSRPVDVLILSEVLYYLGSPSQVVRDLTGLSCVLAADARVILVHPEKDADLLHAPALAALGCEPETRVRMPDADRPVVLDLGCPTAVPQA